MHSGNAVSPLSDAKRLKHGVITVITCDHLIITCGSSHHYLRLASHHMPYGGFVTVFVLSLIEPS